MSRLTISGSAWTDAAGGWTTCSSRGVKYEEVYLKAYNSIAEARQELTKYFDRYNKRRHHQGLDNMTPDEVYWHTIPKLKEAV